MIKICTNATSKISRKVDIVSGYQAESVQLLLYFFVVHRRSQDFVWGCTCLPKMLTTFFSRPPSNTSKSKPPSKNCPKIDSCSGWGCTSCAGGALTHFPCKLGLKKISPPCGGCRCTHCTPWLRLCCSALLYSAVLGETVKCNRIDPVIGVIAERLMS